MHRSRGVGSQDGHFESPYKSLIIIIIYIKYVLVVLYGIVTNLLLVGKIRFPPSVFPERKLTL